MDLFGRREIFTDVDEINDSNILDVLSLAITTHALNQTEIEYLYNYYKGKQPILEKIKQVRPEINNKIVQNYANSIVSFKTGYFVGEPIQYNKRKGDDGISEEINMLNSFMLAENKHAKDKLLADWLHICGVGYRITLPDADEEIDEAPFEIYTLDPRNTFVIKRNSMAKEPMLGVNFVKKSDGTTVYTCYSKDVVYTVVNGDDGLAIYERTPHILGDIPIVQYQLNESMLGAFEIVITQIDALNNIVSNQVNDIEQFVQALMVFKGVDIDSEDYKALRQEGALKVPIDGDVKYLVSSLNQNQTQKAIDAQYSSMLEICGMPIRSASTGSESSTGASVILRNGWSDAEARAKDTEALFKGSEKLTLKIAINICNTLRQMNLKLSDIEIKFTRNNYQNLTEKANVLTMLLSNEKIAPQLAFTQSGMFPDAMEAYTMSMEYYNGNKDSATTEETPTIEETTPQVEVIEDVETE